MSPERLAEIRKRIVDVNPLYHVCTNPEVGWLIDVMDRQEEEIEELTAQLPETMRHCTIRFQSCVKGHGWLTATNWVPHGCPTCERDSLRSANDKLREQLKTLGSRGGDSPRDDIRPTIAGMSWPPGPEIPSRSVEGAMNWLRPLWNRLMCGCNCCRLDRIEESLESLHTKVESIMATQQALTDQLNAVNDKLVKVGTEITKLHTDVIALQEALANAQAVDPALEAAVNKVVAQAGVLDDMNIDAP